MKEDKYKEQSNEELRNLNNDILKSKLLIGSICLLILSFILSFYYRRFIVFIIVFIIIIIGEILSYLYSKKLIKDKYLYLCGIKQIKFEKVKIKKEDLLEKDNFFGYILIDSNIHYIEGLSNKEYIFDYIVFNNIEDLLNYKIDNKKCFRDMKTIDLLMYNGGNPSKFKIL